ncbi:dual specificity protein phosphatase 19-like [Babylonia areolata]|uniref:dual specificity protein phosphatase 19-like n=1 Tax=Babylonia areolata TaxID=304850 RepID=UPI003FD238C7
MEEKDSGREPPSHPHYQDRCPPPLDLAQLARFDRGSLRRTDTVVTHPDGRQVVEGKDEEGHTITKSISFGNLGFCSTDVEDLQVGHVLPGLIIGSQDVAHNLEVLERHKVTHILNVASHVANLFPDRFTYLSLDLRDLPDFPISKAFPQALDFIEGALKEQGCVLVHCNAGVSRSATIVLAHLMKTQGMSLNDAFTYLRSKRSSSFPNSGFMIQLKNYEDSLRNVSS